MVSGRWRWVAAAALATIIVLSLLAALQRPQETATRPAPTTPAGRTGLLPASSPSTQRPSPVPGTLGDPRALPPIDRTRVVEPPIGEGVAAPAQPRRPTPMPGTPTPPRYDVAGVHLTLPQTATVWRLRGPDDPMELLRTLQARLGVSGTVGAVDLPDGSIRYAASDDRGTTIMTFDAATAYLSYVPDTNLLTPPETRPPTPPVETARDWLAQMGFDLRTIAYRAHQTLTPDGAVVEFEPVELPKIATAPAPFMTVGVTSTGAIRYAYGLWLSAAETADVPLRSPGAVWDALAAGEGMLDPPDAANSADRLAITGGSLSYLLTRADDGSFILQPVVELTTPPGARVYVSAAQR